MGIAVGAALALLAPAAAEAGPMSVLYDLDSAVHQLVRPADGSRGLGPSRGTYRQEPSSNHLFQGPSDAQHRVHKLDGRALTGMSSQRMAATLRRAVGSGCFRGGADFGCRSHIVFVDEITRHYNDGLPNSVARPRPGPRPGSPGGRLSRAMRILDVPSPFGGTYASRVHFYVSPNMLATMAAGRGPNYDLGRDGRPHFPAWRAVMPALARAGGVWLEMYHQASGPFTAREWRFGPRRFLSVFRRSGGRADRVHFMLSRAPWRPPGRLPACNSPMSCQWELADLPGANRTILRNGVGAYRLGEQAPGWLRQYNRRLP